jgi:hypothetical protein
MDKAAPRRTRNMAEMSEIQGRCFGRDEIVRSIASFKPRADDIIISPYSKCGTTWLQQTFHCLRTRGDMEFDDISRVVPWIELAGVLGLDLDAPQRALPRGFKSHLPFDQIPNGGRYVVSLRDPKDAAVSMYRFMEGWFFEPGAISLSEFTTARLGARDRGLDYWHHLISWWEERDNPAVLLFSYEQMSAEPEACIRRLATFCGIALDDALLELTLRLSSLSFMLAHKDKFDDLMMREVSERVGNLPPGSDSAKVRAGRVGAHRTELSEELAQTLDAIWADTVTAKLGFKDYAALESELRRRSQA